MKNLVNRNQLPTVILICLGVVIALVGLITLTVVRGDSQVTAKMAAPSTPYVITREGVFELSSTPMTITAEATNPETDVTLVVGRSSDIYGWLGTAAYTEVAGLKSWEELHTEVTEGDGAELEETDPAKADMWVEVLQSKGKVSFTTTEKTAGMAVLATTNGTAKAPALTLGWKTPSSLVWRLPLLILGLILIGAGAVSLWLTKQKDAKSTVEQAETTETVAELSIDESTEESEDTAEPAEVETEVTAEAEKAVEADEKLVEAMEVGNESADSNEATMDEVVAEDIPDDSGEEVLEVTTEVSETAVEIPAEVEEEPERPRTHGAVIETMVGSRIIKFPSRQAIKEARLRGESVIEVDGHTFQTGLIPVVKKVNDVVESELPTE
ncbi:hypothetical protein HMPREF0044_0889 [Gleimia coleocanis DSM 15436]|uniref:Uncharacterized protein n=1 Tax=Gleimia coleocanis DSM 15436 TaxID=525245 RepID=C0W011_9ACTO|nr:hypothetical protein [Gleimia coleocanis]EEH63870.1 hypothetical protein HMPREF0044_0889 [Gleimia coleocanis DSM 15436]